MKIINLVLAIALGLVSATAFACPKGTHLTGGTGPHHKGGKCEAVADAKSAGAKAPAAAPAAAPEAKPAEATGDAKAAKKAGGQWTVIEV